MEAALIGGLAAFGSGRGRGSLGTAYRILTTWLPVFIGWLIMRWLTAKDMI